MDRRSREGELTVGIEDPAQGLNDDMSGLWGQFAHLMTRQQARIDARIDRLEADVAGHKEQLGSLERASESRANRGRRPTERLITLVQRAETKQS